VDLHEMRNVAIFSGLVLGFATFVTAHVALSARIALRQKPRWRGLLALLVPPLGLLWAFRAGWRRLGLLWLAGVAVYLVARIAATA
jgi:hypothetical protein